MTELKSRSLVSLYINSRILFKWYIYIDKSHTVPHFFGVDRSVFSRVGDLLSLACQPNDTVATVIWLAR